MVATPTHRTAVAGRRKRPIYPSTTEADSGDR